MFGKYFHLLIDKNIPAHSQIIFKVRWYRCHAEKSSATYGRKSKFFSCERVWASQFQAQQHGNLRAVVFFYRESAGAHKNTNNNALQPIR